MKRKMYGIRFFAVVMVLVLFAGGCACGRKQEPVVDTEVTVTRGMAPTAEPTREPEEIPVTEVPLTAEATIAPTAEPEITQATPEDTPTVAPRVTLEPISTTAPEPTPTVAPTEFPKETPTPTPVLELVEKGYYDMHVIPDKFNTGCSDTAVLTKINSACVVDGIEYNMGDNGETLVIDLFYRNEEMEEEVVIRNVDFSDKKFSVRHASMIDGTRTIRFENCKFGFVTVEWEQSNAMYEFDKCTFINFYGSNATFKRCFFGGSYYDGMNPFQNVTVTDCYFGGFPQWNEGGRHLDAMQIFGKEGSVAENILVQKCRMEIPIIKSDRSVQINACLMVQLEYSDARNIVFEDCIINGGGYSIYAWDKRGGWSLEDIEFRNISIGSAHLYNDVYPHISEGVSFDHLYDTETLYVSSVWKDESGKIHLCVTNDTEQDRTLVVVTAGQKETIVIESKRTAEEAGAKEAEDLPIDLEIEIDDPATDWVVCYDGEETAERQIRFVNWGNEAVYREIK